MKPTQLNLKAKENLLVLFAYLLIFIAFLGVKWSYFKFDKEGTFYDTRAYLSVANEPLNSLVFWAGERPFTLPLLFKILGVDSQNYQNPDILARVSHAQAWISIVCWVILGITLSSRCRNRWGGVAVFGLILVFSLVYEISRWDLLFLSESLSFSLFALLLASWVWLLELSSSWQKSPKAYLTITGVIIITVLYSFTRDANLYFIAMGAILLTAASFFRRFKLARQVMLIYLVSAALLWFAQNASLNTANRWQIYIYDHYALRLTDTPEFVDYFKRAGLPMIEDLYMKPGTRGSVYQKMLFFNPAYEPVRQWTTAHGKATYIGYLLTHPYMTLSQPLEYAYELLNGASETILYGRSIPASDSYRRPLQPNQVVPRYIRGLTKTFFPIVPAWVYGVIYLGLVGLVGWAVNVK